ncbi:hypothetical protein QJS04_geneDACA023768 [Acorus gramineus]|uniref:Uncharacterized protein n=1 Tax=Acorus gramineus TaxID=55184 RepID=A0AAV9BNP8_ACOGR|nr:hypothetical protein QJS04_geneDACA023768 [Acorus gramineus]
MAKIYSQSVITYKMSNLGILIQGLEPWKLIGPEVQHLQQPPDRTLGWQHTHAGQITSSLSRGLPITSAFSDHN